MAADFSTRAMHVPVLLLLCAALFIAAAESARGALLVYEPFDYAAGTELDGTSATGHNLTGTYAAGGGATLTELEAAAPSLGYGNLIGAPTSAANRLTQRQGVTGASATVSVNHDVLVGPGSAIYWSALFTFDDSSNGNRLANITLTSASGDELSFGEAAVGVRGIRVSADTAATGGLIAAGADASFSDGQTLLLIGRYVNSASAGADTLELIGYDTAQPHVLPSVFDPDDPNAQFHFALEPRDIDFADIASLTFTIRGDSNNFIDELRIGSTYAAVVPEPTTALLLFAGLASLGVLARGRRARRLPVVLAAAAVPGESRSPFRTVASARW